MSLESPAKPHTALNHVHAVQRHLDEITHMLESDAYCVDVMKQVLTAQRLLDRVHRATMHRHLQTCFVEAVWYGREQAAIDELVEAAEFTPIVTAPLNRAAITPGPASNTRHLMTATTLSLPGISTQRCQNALKAILTAVAGVGAVEVDVPTRTAVIHHDHRVSGRQLIDALEEQGYHSTHAWMTTNERTGDLDRRSRRRGLRDGEHASGLTTIESPPARTEADAPLVAPGFLDGDGI
jgi:DNA-binding FrmR family transcriptional regulator/copper chaperone CopZ